MSASTKYKLHRTNTKVQNIQSSISPETNEATVSDITTSNAQ